MTHEKEEEEMKPKGRSQNPCCPFTAHVCSTTIVTEEASTELTKGPVPCIMVVAKDELRRRNVFLANFALKAGRYDDMRNFMDKVGVNVGPQELTVQERNFIFGAYKKVIGEFRKARNNLSDFEKTIAESDGGAQERAIDYRKKIEAAMKRACETILSLLDARLIPSSQTEEINLFYLKMRSDFLRYRAEMKIEDDDSVGQAKKVQEAYALASHLAAEKLNPTHPTRLGIAVNLSVFHNDIMRKPEAALSLAKEAFYEAVGEIVAKGDKGEYINETKHIIQLLRDIDNIWTSKMQNEKGYKTEDQGRGAGSRAGKAGW